MKIVETGDKLIRGRIKYQVVVADDNIFVICRAIKSWNKESRTPKERGGEK